jgi:phosphoglycerate dehydrogenase-like enzyme
LVLRWGRSAYESDADLAREASAARRLGFSWVSRPDHHSVPDDLEDVEVLVVNSKARVTEDVARRLGGGLVHTTTSGVDHIDLAACLRCGVTTSRSPLARRDAVVEQTLTTASYLLRRFGQQVAASREGRWARGDLPMWMPRSLAASTVAVVGMGVIGREVTRRLETLGAEVRCVDPHVDLGHAWQLRDALEGADVLTLHCALTPTSRGLVGGDELDLLPAHGVVINTARGESLDVAAAVARVQAGRLGGLSVDVFPIEPYPELAHGADHPGVLYTPHAAGYTRGLGARVAMEVEATLEAWAAGRPLPHAVSPSSRA